MSTQRYEEFAGRMNSLAKLEERINMVQNPGPGKEAARAELLPDVFNYRNQHGLPVPANQDNLTDDEIKEVLKQMHDDSQANVTHYFAGNVGDIVSQAPQEVLGRLAQDKRIRQRASTQDQDAAFELARQYEEAREFAERYGKNPNAIASKEEREQVLRAAAEGFSRKAMDKTRQLQEAQGYVDRDVQRAVADIARDSALAGAYAPEQVQAEALPGLEDRAVKLKKVYDGLKVNVKQAAAQILGKMANIRHPDLLREAYTLFYQAMQEPEARQG